ncbi:hypothetical protein HanOQP8_Chr01g0036781 [Helianthus annuus]|nr:hypothetical protein HanOQP8_Chr01g0036781 [Helianthus annuus]
MTEIGVFRWRKVSVMVVNCVLLASLCVSAENVTAVATGYYGGDDDAKTTAYYVKLVKSLFQTDGSGYQHVWPVSCCYVFVILC